MKNKNKHRGWIVSLFFVLILVVMAVTCPKKDSHVEVLADRFNYVVNEYLSQGENDLSFLGALLGDVVTKPMVKNYLTVDDYIFFNVGKFAYKGEENPVSFGAFGHVFAISRKELKKRIQENADLQDLLETL